MLKLILFDLDDTLYPEKDYAMSGFNAVSIFLSEKAGIPENKIFANLSATFDSGIRGNIFDVLIDKLNIDLHPHEITDLVDVYREHKPQIELESSTVELLTKLRNEYKIGVITDGYASVQRNKVKALRLEPLVDAVIYSDAWGRECWKPSEKPFRETLKGFGVEPDEAVYVADNPVKDFITARAIGIKTVRLRIPGREHSNVQLDEEHEAEFEIKNLAELPDVLERLSRAR